MFFLNITFFFSFNGRDYSYNAIKKRDSRDSKIKKVNKRKQRRVGGYLNSIENTSSNI